MVTFNVYAIFPERGQEWGWSQTLVREIINSFQSHLSPHHLQHSCHFNPQLPLYPQIQWAKLAIKELESSRKIHPETERLFFFFPPSHFCLQSAWHCWTQAFADEVSIKEQLCWPGSSSHLAPQTRARNVGYQKMQWSNLPLPYHILVDDPLLFKTRDECLWILLANIRGKKNHPAGLRWTQLYRSQASLHRSISVLYTHMRKNTLNPIHR